MQSIEEKADKMSKSCAPFKREIERLHYVDGIIAGYKADREDVVRVIEGLMCKNPINEYHMGGNDALLAILTHLNLNS